MCVEIYFCVVDSLENMHIIRTLGKLKCFILQEWVGGGCVVNIKHSPSVWVMHMVKCPVCMRAVMDLKYCQATAYTPEFSPNNGLIWCYRDVTLKIKCFGRRVKRRRETWNAFISFVRSALEKWQWKGSIQGMIVIACWDTEHRKASHFVVRYRWFQEIPQ